MPKGNRAIRRIEQKFEQQLRAIEEQLRSRQNVRRQASRTPLPNRRNMYFDWNCQCGYYVYGNRDWCPRCNHGRRAGAPVDGVLRREPVQQQTQRSQQQQQLQTHQQPRQQQQQAQQQRTSQQPPLHQATPAVPARNHRASQQNDDPVLAPVVSPPPPAAEPTHDAPPVPSDVPVVFDMGYDEQVQLELERDLDDRTVLDLDGTADPATLNKRIRGVQRAIERRNKARAKAQTSVEEQKESCERAREELERREHVLTDIDDRIRHLTEVQAELATRLADVRSSELLAEVAEQQQQQDEAVAAAASQPLEPTRACKFVLEMLRNYNALDESGKRIASSFGAEIETIMAEYAAVKHAVGSSDPLQPAHRLCIRQQDPHAPPAPQQPPGHSSESVTALVPYVPPQPALAIHKQEEAAKLSSDNMWEDTATRGKKRELSPVAKPEPGTLPEDDRDAVGPVDQAGDAQGESKRAFHEIVQAATKSRN